LSLPRRIRYWKVKANYCPAACDRIMASAMLHLAVNGVRPEAVGKFHTALSGRHSVENL
jgi:hypothetical protein